MLIGDVSKRTGLSRDAIRYYEKFGLLKLPAKSRRQNNYRDYTDDDLKKLFFIQLLHEYGFTLQEIRNLIAKHEAEEKPFEDMQAVIQEKIQSISRQMTGLENKKARLTALADYYKQSQQRHLKEIE